MRVDVRRWRPISNRTFAGLHFDHGDERAGGVSSNVPRAQSVRLGRRIQRRIQKDASLTGRLSRRVDFARRAFELRTFEYLDAVHRRRFGRSLDIDRAAYDQFIAIAKQMLDVMHLETAIVGPPDDLMGSTLPSNARALRSTRAVWLVVFGAILGFSIWRLLAKI